MDVGRGSLIDILEISCNAVKNNKPEVIQQLIPQIDSLTRHFKTFELAESWNVSTSEGYAYSFPCTQLSTHYNEFHVCFLRPEMTPDELSNKYGNFDTDSCKVVVPKFKYIRLHEECIYQCVS